MNPELQFVLDTVIRWLPYIAVVIFVPVVVFTIRCLFRGTCENGPIYRSRSRTDEELGLQMPSKGSQGNHPIGRHQSMPNMFESDDIFRTVNLKDSSTASSATASSRTDSPLDKGICSLCMRLYSEEKAAKSLPCKHRFHHQCANDWFSKKGYCPQCILPSSASFVK